MRGLADRQVCRTGYIPGSHGESMVVWFLPSSWELANPTVHENGWSNGWYMDIWNSVLGWRDLGALGQMVQRI